MNRKHRYLTLLSRQYPNRYAVYSKLINLNAVLNMPKGTEHFISDIHGEYEAFKHIINNCSGVIKEKVKSVFPDLCSMQKNDLCTLIYYPKEVLSLLKKEGKVDEAFYKDTIIRLVQLSNFFMKASSNHNPIKHNKNLGLISKAL